MRNAILLLAAATMMSASAMASKARVGALQGANHINDFQTMFVNPSDIMFLGDQATFEFGAGNAYSNGAEGGFIKSFGGNKFGFYFGGESDQAYRYATGFLGAENPFEVFYGWKSGDMDMGASFYYSNTAKRSYTTATSTAAAPVSPSATAVTEGKQSTMGLRLGAATSVWDASLLLGLGSTAGFTNGATEHKFTGKSSMTIYAGYNLSEDQYLSFGYASKGAKAEAGATSLFDAASSAMSLGYNRSFKVDGGSFYYNVKYVSTSSKDTVTPANDEVATSLPVSFGVEADAASWLVLRGSFSQNVFMGSTKSGTADAESIANNSTIAAGAGLKFNKFMLDGSLEAGSDGDFGLADTDLMGSVALTYNF